MKALAAAAGALALLRAAGAQAGAIPYPDAGAYNPVIYSFTATTSGDIVAYFAGSGAGYDNTLGLLVNGVAQGGYGLDDHASSVGQSYDFGAVAAGATLVFVLNNLSLGELAYSDPTLNLSYDNGPATGTTDGHNHVYSTSYDGTGLGGGIPAGTYVAFEDEPFPGSDYNYFDETFVFTNVSTTSSIPEPSAWALMVLGTASLGAGLRRRRLRPLAAR